MHPQSPFPEDDLHGPGSFGATDVHLEPSAVQLQRNVTNDLLKPSSLQCGKEFEHTHGADRLVSQHELRSGLRSGMAADPDIWRRFPKVTRTSGTAPRAMMAGTEMNHPRTSINNG